jgi:hypothetical protein
VRPGTRTTRSTRTLQTSMIPLLAGWPGPTSAQVGIPSIMLLCRTRTALLYCYSTSTCMFVVENFISIMLLKNSIMFEVFLSIYKFRVEREYLNPNPKLRVPAISGNTISGLTSGNISITRTFHYPNYPTRSDRVTRTPRVTSDAICWICTARPDSELSSVGKRVVALWFEYIRGLLAGSVFTSMESIPS